MFVLRISPASHHSENKVSGLKAVTSVGWKETWKKPFVYLRIDSTRLFNGGGGWLYCKWSNTWMRLHTRDSNILYVSMGHKNISHGNPLLYLEMVSTLLVKPSVKCVNSFQYLTSGAAVRQHCLRVWTFNVFIGAAGVSKYDVFSLSVGFFLRTLFLTEIPLLVCQLLNYGLVPFKHRH